jgi:hypothetical protein
VLRRESTNTTKEQEARRFLKQREGAAAEGRVIAPRVEHLTVAQLFEALRDDYKANGRRSADRPEFSLAHVLPARGARRAVQVTSADVTSHRVQRLDAGAPDFHERTDCIEPFLFRESRLPASGK